MDTISTVAGIGTAGKMAAAMKATAIHTVAQQVADLKAMVKEASDAYRDAEKAFLALGQDEVVLPDGRTVLVVHSQVRDIDTDAIRDILPTDVFDRIAKTSVVATRFDAEVEAGRLDEAAVASTITFKDRKPAVKIV
jgi:hypothetical protein